MDHAPLTYPRELRKRAWDALVEYAEKQFGACILPAQETFFGDTVARLPAGRRDEVLRRGEIVDTFFTWFIFEANFDGRSVTDEFLAAMGNFRSRSELSYIRAMRGSRLRLYEVETVARDVGLRLRDCQTGKRIDVRERLFTHEAVPNMIVPLRLRNDPDGQSVIDGSVLGGLDHNDKDQILRKLGAAPDQSQAPAIVQQWIERFFLAPPPILTTSSGDPMMLCTIRYDVRDRSALERALAGVNGIEDEGDGRYTWVRGRGRIVHANLRIEGAALIVETLSRKRARAARTLIERRCDESVLTFRDRKDQDPMEALEEHRRSVDAEPREQLEAAVPPEIAAQVIAQAEERHYRAWIDTPLPALFDKTPRQAARIRSLRRLLVNLLKDFDVASARCRNAGEHAYDFAWMWSELGIDPSDPFNARRRPKRAHAGGAIYQLKIVLRGSKPPIWRRVLIDGEERLDRVHLILNSAMGWLDGHLHAFRVGNQTYAVPDPEEAWFEGIDERKVRLAQLGLREGRSFDYDYDFGDGWSHRVTLEGIVPPEPDARYPLCIGGKRACPPEDVGGIYGFRDFLASSKRQAQFDYAPGEFDPEAFDRDAVNEGLRSLPKKWRPLM